MDLRIVDRARGVTAGPAKGPPFDDPRQAMRDLARGQHIASGRVEYECDQEFWDALEAQEGAGLAKHDEIAVPRGKRLATFDGVPVVIVEEKP